MKSKPKLNQKKVESLEKEFLRPGAKEIGPTRAQSEISKTLQKLLVEKKKES